MAGILVGVGCLGPGEMVWRDLGRDPVRCEVLTESGRLVRPGEAGRSRWVRGWRFGQKQGGLAAVTTSRTAVAEIVRLDTSARRVRVVPAGDVASPGASIQLAEGAPVALDGSGPWDVPITPGGRPGVLPIRCASAGPGTLALRQIRLLAPRPAGSVSFRDGAIEQSGWSMARWTLSVGAGVRIEGSFEPPSDPVDGQAFEAEVLLDEGSADTLLSWRGEDGAPVSGGRRTFYVEVAPGSRFVQLRLVARGQGPPGRWTLRVGERVREIPSEVAAPVPPRAVVVYVLDALRADLVGHLGSDLGVSGTLDELAAGGATFAHHVAVAPSTGPSTVALFTGIPGTSGRAIPAGTETLAEHFAAAGYRTGAFSSNPTLSREYGLTTGFESVAFSEIVEDFVPGARTTNDSARRVHADTVAWLDSLAPGEKVFAYLHTLHPHNPYTPPDAFLGRHLDLPHLGPVGTTRELVDIRDGKRTVTPDDIAAIRAAYAASVQYNDTLLADLVAELEKRFAPDELLLVVTSDHGEELFEHDGVLHGYTLYDEMLRIPLVVRWPGVVPAGRVTAPTTTLDLHATLAALVSPSPAPPGDPPATLWQELRGGPGGRARFVAFAFAPGIRNAGFMARSPTHKLVEAQPFGPGSGMGYRRGRTFDSEYVFDLDDDPGELANLAGEPDLEVEWLRAELRAVRERWRIDADDPEPEADDTTRRRLEALGYVVDE